MSISRRHFLGLLGGASAAAMAGAVGGFAVVESDWIPGPMPEEPRFLRVLVTYYGTDDVKTEWQPLSDAEAERELSL